MTETATLKAGSNLEKVFAAGKFAVTAECGPPKSADGQRHRRQGQAPRGRSSMPPTSPTTRPPSCASARWSRAICAMDNGLEPIMQMTCRDRNRLAMQADILGAAAIGIKNILCLTGDHGSFGNHPQAKGVFDLDAIQLIRMFKDMRDDEEVRLRRGDGRRTAALHRLRREPVRHPV